MTEIQQAWIVAFCIGFSGPVTYWLMQRARRAVGGWRHNDTQED